MQENFKLYLKGVPKEDREIVVNSLDRLRAKYGEKIPNEYEKSSEEIKAIEVINNYIQKEIKTLGLNPRNSIENDRVHFINKDIANALKIKSDGAYSNEKDSVFLVKDNFKKGRLNFYKTLLHEIIHYYSFNAIMATQHNHSINNYRSGYTGKNHTDDDLHEHFRGFNEVLVEKILKDILIKNNKELIQEFNISELEINNQSNISLYYQPEIQVVEMMVNRMAEGLKKSPEEIWQKFKKGFFTGEMMHLREVENFFGPGSLRVLSAMSSDGNTKNVDNRDLFAKFEQFFQAENQEQRDKIANQILSERERLKYKEIKR